MILALLIFLPTLIFFPHILYSLGIFYIPKKLKFDINILIITLIIILSFINQIVNFNNAIIYNKNIFSIYPYYFFILISFYLSKSINETTKRFLIYLVSIETVVAIFEFILHVPTFFPNFVSSELPSSYGYKGLLYYSRVFGLSNNSSELSFKIFATLLLLDTIEIKRYVKQLLYFILFVGIYITFNRSVILSLVLFYFIKKFPFILRFLGSKIKRFPKRYLLYSIITIIILAFILYYSSNIIFQFTRGISLKLDTFKRHEVYKYFYDFILSNPIMGNGSYKLFYFFQNKLFHAHNSFIQIFATNGFIIAFLYIFLILKNTNRYNLNYVLAFIVLSLTQYAIFWGISFLDIILFYFLFNYKVISNDE